MTNFPKEFFAGVPNSDKKLIKIWKKNKNIKYFEKLINYNNWLIIT